MSLSGVASYLETHGPTCTLAADDPAVPDELRPFLQTLPDKRLTITVPKDGVAPTSDGLKITATTADHWPVAGLDGTSVTLATVALTLTTQQSTTTVDMTAGGKLTLGTTSAACIVTHLPSGGGWAATLAEDIASIKPTDLAAHAPGSFGALAVPVALTALGVDAKAASGALAVRFSPSARTAILSFEVDTGEHWQLLDGAPPIGPLLVDATLATRFATLALKTSVQIDGKTIDVIVSLGTGGEVSVDLQAEKFPDLADLLKWILSGSADATSVGPGLNGLGLDPDAFNASVKGVRFTVDTEGAKAASVNVLGALTVAAIPLDVMLGLPPASLSGTLHPDAKVTLAQVIAATGLPPIDGALGKCTLQTVAFAATPALGMYFATLEVDGALPLGPFTFEKLGGTVRHDAAGLRAQILCSVEVAKTVELDLLADYDPQLGWQFAGRTGAGGLSIDALLGWIRTTYNVNRFAPPKVLDTLELTDVGLTYAVKSGEFTFHCIGQLEAEGTKVDLIADATLTADTGGGHDVKFGGKLTVAGMELDVTFSDKDGGATFAATYSSKDDLHIPLAELAGSIAPALEESLPTDLAIPLRGLGLVRMPAVKDTPALWLVRCRVELHLALSDLPVVGGQVPAPDDVSLSGVDFIWGTRTLSANEVGTANSLLGAQLPTQPPPRVGLILALTVAGQPKTVPVPLVRDSPGKSVKHVVLAALPAADAQAQRLPPAPGTPSTTAWLDVQRSLGPVSLQRIGVYYRSGHVFVVFDASFKLAAFALDLEGLGLGFTPQWPPSVTPALDGIGVSLDEGAVSVSGGLRRVVTEGQPDRYDGALSVKLEDLELAALGSYTKTVQGASMFAFAVLDYPLGGPPVFFVTGLAAGFGVNRDLRVPDLTGLPKFPLIEAVTGSPGAMGGGDVGEAVTAMGAAIPIDYGENWVALGARFTTFELVQTSALLVARWGNELEFDILGLSIVSLPAGDPKPIAYAELAFEASYKPSDGVLAIGGQLTPASYLLTKDCHLTGGFAFRSWMRDLGPASAGDFVMTVGGYHPAYHVPGHYPQVPRLGVDWQVDSHLAVRGQLYYALTPNALMAGGKIDATWQSDGLSAWFTAYADFLLAWRPFYYEADAGISIGASYEVDLWLTSFTVTVHVGVDIEFHGPPFGGSATVDLYVASITIRFGEESDASPKPISWSEFKAGFLPAAKDRRVQLAAGAMVEPTRITTDTYCFTRVTGGLLKTFSPPQDGVDWVIEPEQLELTTVSALPCSGATLTVDGTAAHGLTPADLPGFGVGPVGIANGNLKSEQAIVITSRGGEKIDKISFDVEPVRANVPGSPWLSDVALAGGDAAKLGKQPTLVARALTGFVLRPEVPQSDTTHSIDLARLQSADDPNRALPPRAARAIPTSDDFDQAKALDQLAATIDDTGVGSARDAILGRLRASGLAVPSTVDGGALKTDLPPSLRRAPVLSHLGEQPA